MSLVETSSLLLLTHFAAAFFGFAVGGFVAYKLIIRKMKSRVNTMFGFGDAGNLIDAMADVQDEGEE